MAIDPDVQDIIDGLQAQIDQLKQQVGIGTVADSYQATYPGGRVVVYEKKSDTG